MSEADGAFEPPTWLGIATDLNARDVIGEARPRSPLTAELARLLQRSADNDLCGKAAARLKGEPSRYSQDRLNRRRR
jgi:hypothetical protein